VVVVVIVCVSLSLKTNYCTVITMNIYVHHSVIYLGTAK
jgi:hypothetical protein